MKIVACVLVLMCFCVDRCKGLDCLAVVEYLREKLQADNDKVILVSRYLFDVLLGDFFPFSVTYFRIFPFLCAANIICD